MIKIGHTTRTPSKRAYEITTVSGLVKPCTVAFMVKVDDCKAVEKTAHKLLAHRRIRDRELFKVDAATAIEAINEARRMCTGTQSWNFVSVPEVRDSQEFVPFRRDRPILSRTIWLIGTLIVAVVMVLVSMTR